MKTYFSLIIFVVFLAFFTGYLGFTLNTEFEASREDITNIKRIKNKFFQQIRSIETVDISNYYPNYVKKSLLSDTFLSQKNSNLTYKVFTSEDDCFKHLPQFPSNNQIDKVLIWEEIRCGFKAQLPSYFISTPPLMHPSGVSYAFLAYLYFKKRTNDDKWFFPFLSYFHVDELSLLTNDGVQLPKPYKYFEEFGEGFGNALLNRAEALVSRNYLMFLKWDIFSFGDLKYSIYSRELFEDYLFGAPYSISGYKPGKKCLYKEGQICWNYSIAHMVGLYSTKQLFFLAISLIATMIILLFIFQKLRNEQKENERKGLAFRILSHELRTPIASLLLRIDGIIKKIQNYSDQEQIELLKLSSDIHRLHRLSEMSKHYLTVNSGEKLIKLNYKKIDSAERFFDSFIDEFEDLDYSFEGDDFEFYSDPFWLNICIKNLLKNAYMHGQRPVKLKVLKTKKHKLSITVEDQGEPEFDKLGEMLKEFNKSSKSEGSGLGLNIVYKVLRIMKGKIEFLRSPTRFIVEIGIGNDRESITD